MPIYVFKCENCGEFEKLVNFNDDKPQKCPDAAER